MITIYCLRDAAGIIRYIGKTSAPLKKRLQRHLQSRRRKESSHRLNWLRHLLVPPAIEVIEWCLPMHWEARERYHIALARDYGCSLVNTTEGGDILPDNRGRKATPEHCEKISRANKGRKKSPEHIENSRWSESRREVMRRKLSGENNPMFGRTGDKNHFYGRSHTPATIAQMSRAKLGKKRGSGKKG